MRKSNLFLLYLIVVFFIIPWCQRLAKRWVSAHLFSSFLAEEAIELVVAYLFLKPFPFHAPCSRVTGFLRYILFFILKIFFAHILVIVTF